jgi:DNA replication protein DnaC
MTPSLEAPRAPATLDDALDYLRLVRLKAAWREACSRAAAEEQGYEAFLSALVLDEAASAWDKTVRYRFQAARLPQIKTIDQFDFAHPRKLSRQMVLDWLDLRFLERSTNLLLLGPSGVGKSHLALAVAHRAFARCLAQYTRPRLLVLDELGYLPLDKGGADLLFQVITKRYERGSIILTTNLAFKQWDQVFGSVTTASAVLDRLLHHAEVLNIEGNSYRLKDRKERLARSTD